MRRLRHYLPVVSLFLGLGLANAMLYFAMAKTELEWGAEEQVKARAISLAGLYTTSASDEREAARMRDALARINKEAGGVEAVYYEDTRGGWVPTFLSDLSEIPTPGLPGATILEQLKNGEAVAQRLLRTEAADILVAYAARPEKDGKLRCVFAVAIEDRVVRDGLREVLRTCAWFVLGSFLAGVVLAELISFMFMRALRRLEEESASLETDEQGGVWSPSRISEINDLTNTLKAIGVVLHENVKQTWRRFQQEELLPRQEELANDYQVLCDAEEMPGDKAFRADVRRIGGGSCDEFFVVQRIGKSWVVAAGKLEAPEGVGMPLERVVRANAARNYFKVLCAAGKDAELWVRLAAVFPVIVGEHVVIDSSSPSVRKVVRYPGARDGEVTGGDKRDVVGTLSTASLAKAREHVRSHPGQTLEAVASSLEAYFSDEDRGVLVVFEVGEDEG